MVEQAAQAGADAIKFQAYKAQTIASRHSPAYWDRTKEPASNQFELFQRYDRFGPQEYRQLAAHAQERKIHFSCTPFDRQAVEFLDDLMPMYKIASADLTNVPLLRQVAAKGKPIILSVGASTVEEIRHALDVLIKAGVKRPQIALLHCVLNYPCGYESANLGRITRLVKLFPEHVIGYSDHTVPDPGMTPLVAAVTLGACIIEKHFTFDKSLPGNDHYHAMDPQDLTRFCKQLEILSQVNQDLTADYLPSEEPARREARRSLVAVHEIKRGQRLTQDSFIPKRPGHGISPVECDRVVGCTAEVDIPADTVLQWNMLTPGTTGTPEITPGIMSATSGSSDRAPVEIDSGVGSRGSRKRRVITKQQ